jgi:hypothetical protein
MTAIADNAGQIMYAFFYPKVRPSDSVAKGWRPFTDYWRTLISISAHIQPCRCNRISYPQIFATFEPSRKRAIFNVTRNESIWTNGVTWATVPPPRKPCWLPKSSDWGERTMNQQAGQQQPVPKAQITTPPPSSDFGPQKHCHRCNSPESPL